MASAEKRTTTLAPLERTWVQLIILSTITTGLTFTGQTDLLGSAAILMLTFFKSRMILGTYLELNNCSFWLRGLCQILLVFVIAIYLMLVIGGLASPES